MSVEVCTVWAPRPTHEKWRGDEYLRLLALQRRTAKYFNHRHTLITDDPSIEGAMQVQLPENLMQALLAGICARLRASARDHIAFLDMDVLVARPLDAVFHSRQFELGLTHRVDEVSPINNGSMFVHANAREKALTFFEACLAECQLHWGGDQEAISRRVMPVPEVDTDSVEMRNGILLWFMRMKVYAAVPKELNKPHKSFTVHFKGETKAWAEQYARSRILL